MIGELVLAMEAVAPRRLAAPWDNTGLLLGDPSRELRRALITVDLTNTVLDEAIAAKCQAIVAYHPPIFEPLKNITAVHAHGRIILRCAENKIAILSPHTALDAVQGGMTDWLADFIDTGERAPLDPATQADAPQDETKGGKTKPRNSARAAGQGRALTLAKPRTCARIAKGLRTRLRIPMGNVSYCELQGSRKHKRVAVVPGSGAGLLTLALEAGCTLMVTGEAKHHDVIRAQEHGCDMILLGHTNSERGFLARFAQQLQPHVPRVRLLVSKSDRHPLRIA